MCKCVCCLHVDTVCLLKRLQRAVVWGKVKVIIFPWRLLTLWRCFFLHIYGKKNTITAVSYKIFEQGNVRHGQVGGMEKESKEGISFPSSVTVPLTLSHIFFWLWCVRVYVCVGCGLSLMWDPAADVTFMPVKATRASHTLVYVTHQSDRKCVFPLTILPLFPIKSTKENVIHSCAARLTFSLHVLVNQL